MGKYGGFVAALGLVLTFKGAVQAEDAMEFSLEEATQSPGAAASGAQERVTAAMGDLRWGMSRRAVLITLKKQLRAEFEEKIRVEQDIVRQDALYEESRERFRAIKDGFVEFNGRKTGWDISPLAPEFRHGSHEAMLVVRGAGIRDHYFFINDRLWKWYREIPVAKSGGFDGMSELMAEQFGRAQVVDRPRDEHSPAYASMSWDTRDTRVTVFDRGAETCLVFEARKTLKHLAVLRRNAQPRGKRRNNILEGVLMDEGEREDWRAKERTKKRSGPPTAALASN